MKTSLQATIHDAYVRGFIAGFMTLAGVIIVIAAMMRWVL